MEHLYDFGCCNFFVFFYRVNKAVVHVHDADSPVCSWGCRWVGWWRCCSWPAATAPRWPRGWWCWGVRTLPSWPRRRKASSTTCSRLLWSEPWTVCGTLSSGLPSSWSCPPADAHVTLHLKFESSTGRVSKKCISRHLKPRTCCFLRIHRKGSLLMRPATLWQQVEQLNKEFIFEHKRYRRFVRKNDKNL